MIRGCPPERAHCSPIAGRGCPSKASIGKVHLPEPVGTWVERRTAQQSIELLSVTHAHAAEVEALPAVHRDPFDRILVAQARREVVAIVTGDPLIRGYGVEVIW